jgi:hypothetical protein
MYNYIYLYTRMPSLRQHSAVVLQEPGLFSMTIAENIRIGAGGTLVTPVLSCPVLSSLSLSYFHLTSILLPSYFHLTSILLPSYFHLTSILLPSYFHVTYMLHSTLPTPLPCSAHHRRRCTCSCTRSRLRYIHRRTTA